MYNMAPARPHDYFQVGCLMRQADIDEANHGNFEDHCEALLWTAENSHEVIAVYADDGSTIGLWGYRPDGFGGAQVWAVGTDRFVESPKAMLKTGKAMRDALFEHFDIIYNSVFVGNTVHIDWLKRLGAEFFPSDDPHFVYFEIRK